jgi:hypothetical protein
MGGACSTYGEGRGADRVLMRKAEERRPLGISRRRWDVAGTGSIWLRIGIGGRC